jgi:hypothetical protein
MTIRSDNALPRSSQIRWRRLYALSIKILEIIYTKSEILFLANSNIANALKLHQKNEQKHCLPLVHAISHLNKNAVIQLIAQDIHVNSIFVQPDYDVIDTEYCPEVIEREIFITPLGYAVHCVEVLAREEKDVTPAINIIHCLL